MALFNDWLNGLKDMLIGKDKDFETLIARKDITGAMAKFTSNKKAVEAAIKEYDNAQHEIMKLPPRIVTNKDGKIVKKVDLWKIPIPYPVYINEISLVFLYGRPVKWSQLSDDTDNAFAAFQDVIKRTRFNSKIRQCKRLAGAETECAMLFRCYRDNDGKPDVQIRVLAKSKGDDIFVRRDQYENIISAAWGYYLKDNGKTTYHYDIFTPKTIYHCTRGLIGWDIEEEENLIGKIPMIFFWQDKEWSGVEQLINREERIASGTADTNDYFANPIAMISADNIKNMPNRDDPNKTLLIKGLQEGQKLDDVAKYLTWDSAPESKKQELEWLEEKILTMSFTPKISLDSLKSISQLSAKALHTVMLLADIKASKHKEQHDELLDRTANLIIAIIRNVLDIGLSAELDKLRVGHEWQEPFGDDISEAITNIIRLKDADILSQETAVERNPYIQDNKQEMTRLQKEKEEREQKQNDIFGTGE